MLSWALYGGLRLKRAMNDVIFLSAHPWLSLSPHLQCKPVGDPAAPVTQRAAQSQIQTLKAAPRTANPMRCLLWQLQRWVKWQVPQPRFACLACH